MRHAFFIFIFTFHSIVLHASEVEDLIKDLLNCRDIKDLIYFKKGSVIFFYERVYFCLIIIVVLLVCLIVLLLCVALSSLLLQLYKKDSVPFFITLSHIAKHPFFQNVMLNRSWTIDQFAILFH